MKQLLLINFQGIYAYDGSRWSQEAFMPAGTWGADVKGISFYTGGHPSDISDRGKEAMIITDDTTNRNVGIGVHVPKSKLQLGGDLYISAPSKGLIIRDSSGGCHRITVANGGGLVTSGTIACP